MSPAVTTGTAPDRTRRGAAFWLICAVDVALVVGALLPGIDLRVYREPAVLLGYGALWIGIGLVYIVIRLVRLRRSRRDAPGSELLSAGRAIGYLVTAATTLQVLSSGVVLALGSPVENVAGPAFGRAAVGLSFVTVIVAWSILHLAYAERYARIWLREAARTGDEPIAFPGTPSPRRRDFAYFSFTVGLSFATSDAEIRSPAIRATVLWHGVLSFVYNTAILGVVVGLIAG